MAKSAFVLLSFDSWLPVQSRKHHMARALARLGRWDMVLYVTPPRNGEGFEVIPQDEALLTVITPLAPSVVDGPPPAIYPLAFDAAAAITTLIADYLSAQGVVYRVVCCQNPFYSDVVLSLASGQLVVDLTDRYDKLFPDLAQAHDRSMLALLSRADVVIAVSRPLLQLYEKLPGHARCAVIPNGVDSSHFDPSRPLGVPDWAREIPHPRLGYVGRLVGRLDRPLIEQVVHLLPEAHFVFIGPALVDHDWLTRLPRCHVIGPRPYDSLPQHIAQFDLCLIPHLLNEETAVLDPVKLNEYLAMGKPVVSTTAPGLARSAEHIVVAATAEAFASACRGLLLRVDSQEDANRRRLSVIDLSWKRLANVVAEIIASTTAQPIMEK